MHHKIFIYYKIISKIHKFYQWDTKQRQILIVSSKNDSLTKPTRIILEFDFQNLMALSM